MATVLTFVTALAVVAVFLSGILSLIAFGTAWATTRSALAGLAVAGLSFITNPWAVISTVWLAVAACTGGV